MTKEIFKNIYCVISIKILVYFSYKKGTVCECIIQSLLLLKRKSERDKIGRGKRQQGRKKGYHCYAIHLDLPSEQAQPIWALIGLCLFCPFLLSPVVWY